MEVANPIRCTARSRLSSEDANQAEGTARSQPKELLRIVAKDLSLDGVGL